MKKEEKKLNILCATNYFAIGGAENIVLQQVNLLFKKGHVVFLGLLRRTRKKENLYSRLLLPQNHIFHFDAYSVFNIFAYLKVFMFLKKNKIDVVISHLFESNTIFRTAAIFARVKVIMSTEHSVYSGKSWWQKKIDRLLSFYTDIIFGVSKEVVEFTSAQEKIAFTKFKILNQLIDPSIENIFNKSDFKKELGISDDSSIVMTVGRFSEEKAQYRIIEIAKKLYQSIPESNVYFLIVGYGPLKQSLTSLVDQYKLEKYVRIIEDPLRAKEYLILGDIFLLTSNREGVPVAMLEAMAHGLVPVASLVGGVPSVIKDTDSGFLVPSQDINMYVEKIKSLTNDGVLLNNMAESAKRRARECSGTIDDLESVIFDLYFKN